MTQIDLSKLEVNRNDLLDGKEWGDGYCLHCGEAVHSLDEGELGECPHCGSVAAMSAADLLLLAFKLARCNSPYMGEL